MEAFNKQIKKEIYLTPSMSVIEFSANDIIRTSNGNDDNQGEWDKQ